MKNRFPIDPKQILQVEKPKYYEIEVTVIGHDGTVYYQLLEDVPCFQQTFGEGHGTSIDMSEKMKNLAQRFTIGIREIYK
jgi:hypothetical protein